MRSPQRVPVESNTQPDSLDSNTSGLYTTNSGYSITAAGPVTLPLGASSVTTYVISTTPDVMFASGPANTLAMTISTEGARETPVASASGNAADLSVAILAGALLGMRTSWASRTHEASLVRIRSQYMAGWYTETERS
jgi:hypothetical protein